MPENNDVSGLSAEDLRAALAAKESTSTVIDEDGAEVEPPSTDVATKDDNLPEPWKHDTIEFLGDTLEVRQPTEQALAAFSLASGKYVPQKLQNDIVSLFVKQHLSEESLERVYFRLLDPDDPDYAPSTIGELMGKIAMLGREPVAKS